MSKHEARYFNIDETAYILQLIESEPLKYRTMITLAIFGGMREGELTALKWKDIDLDNRIININKSLQHLPNQNTFLKTTKTENTRVISLPPSAIALLREYKLWQNCEKTKLADLWNDGNLSKEDKIKYLIREVNFHGLRHTSASILINQNQHVTTLSKRLGHAKTSTTVDIYSHLLQKSDMTAADKFENLFNKKEQNEKQDS